MRRQVWLLAALLAGVGAGALISGCECFDYSTDVYDVGPETFMPTTRHQNLANEIGIDQDYTLKVELGRMRAVESFTRAGIKHRTEYALAEATPAPLAYPPKD